MPRRAEPRRLKHRSRQRRRRQRLDNATLRPPKVNLETDFWNQFSLLTYRDSSCYSLFLLNHENCDLKNILIPLFLSFKKNYIYFCYIICFQVILKIQIWIWSLVRFKPIYLHPRIRLWTISMAASLATMSWKKLSVLPSITISVISTFQGMNNYAKVIIETFLVGT